MLLSLCELSAVSPLPIFTGFLLHCNVCSKKSMLVRQSEAANEKHTKNFFFKLDSYHLRHDDTDGDNDFQKQGFRMNTRGYLLKHFLWFRNNNCPFYCWV